MDHVGAGSEDTDLLIDGDDQRLVHIEQIMIGIGRVLAGVQLADVMAVLRQGTKEPKALTHVSSRIVMSPLGAKLLYRALAENLAKYEAAFGEIKVPGSGSLAEHLFRPPNPPENPPEK